MKLWACVWLVFAFAIFVLTFVVGFRRKRNLKSALKILLLGIVFTDFILLSSIIYYGNVYTAEGNIYIEATEKKDCSRPKQPDEKDETVVVKSVDSPKPFILIHSTEFEIKSEKKLPFAIIYGLIYAPKMGAFVLKYPSLFAAAFKFPWGLGIPYGLFTLILSFVTPLIFGGFLVSYIKTLWYFISYHTKRRIKDVYYFSELNEKALLLAEDIFANEKRKALIVFCNCGNVSGEFSERADRSHFVLLSENERDLVLNYSLGNKKKYYFEISQDDNKNLDTTKRLIEFYDTFKKDFLPNVKIFLFMKSSLFGSELISKNNQKKINVILVDSVKSSVYNLLFEKSFCGKGIIDEKAKSLSVAVFGSGVYAKEFFRNAIWASVLDESYKVSLAYLDNGADEYKSLMERDCKDLFEQNYNFNFYNVDLQSSELESVLAADLPNPNYIVIDTGNDEENLKLAIYLRVFYIRNSDDFNLKPFIAVRISDSKMADRVDDLTDDDGFPYSLYSFGYDSEIYSYSLIVDSAVEKLAMNCHAAYNKKSEGFAYETKDSAVFGCNSSEFGKSSNRAAAVHIKNKLFLMGLELVPYEGEPTQEQINETEKALGIFAKYVNDGQKMEELQKVEHERWRAFHFAEGWKTPTLEETFVYRKLLVKDNKKKHKYVLARMHGCLCSWEDLDALEKEYGNFKIYDEVFIREIPSIIGCQKNNPGNIAGAKFMLAVRG